MLTTFSSFITVTETTY